MEELLITDSMKQINTFEIITNNNNKELVAYVVVDKKYKTSKENKTEKL